METKLTIQKNICTIICCLMLSLSASEVFAARPEMRATCTGADAAANIVGTMGAGLGATAGFKVGAAACGLASILTFGLAAPLCPVIIGASTLVGGLAGGIPSAKVGYAIGAEFDDEACQTK